MESKKLVVQAPSVCLFLYPQLSFFVSTRLLGMCTTLNPARGLVIFGLGKSSRPTTAAPGVAGLHGTVHQKWQKSVFCRDLKILSERSTLKVGLRKEEKKPKKYIIFRIGSERNRSLLISN